MSPTDTAIAAALRQTKPFSSPETAVYLAFMRVASRFDQEISDLLRPRGITPAQYNVLRILRGSESEGMACGGILERLVTRDPDITRLLDRLEKLGLVTRSRDSGDRRVVLSRITAAGRELLADLDAPIADLHARQFAVLDAAELDRLSELLDKLVRQVG